MLEKKVGKHVKTRKGISQERLTRPRLLRQHRSFDEAAKCMRENDTENWLLSKRRKNWQEKWKRKMFAHRRQIACAGRAVKSWSSAMACVHQRAPLIH